MRSSIDVHVALTQLGVEHEIYPLPTPLRRMEEAPEQLGVPPEEVACPRVYKVSASGSTSLIVLYEPAGRRGAASPERHSELRLALALEGRLEPVSEEEEASLTGFLPGLVAPAPLPDRTQVFLEASLTAGEILYFPSGDPGALLKLRVRDLPALGAQILPKLGPSPPDQL